MREMDLGGGWLTCGIGGWGGASCCDRDRRSLPLQKLRWSIGVTYETSAVTVVRGLGERGVVDEGDVECDQ